MSITNGMAFDAPEDAQAAVIQRWIQEYGIAEVASKVTGLSLEHEIIRRVEECWSEVEKRRRDKDEKNNK